MGLINEFKEFAMRGNVVDMAVGIIIGAAFTTIVNSMVDDILMPPLGLVAGEVDFSDLFINLGAGEYVSLAEARQAGAPVIAYGLFINNVINFLFVAFAVFLLIKGMNRLRRRQEQRRRRARCRRAARCCSRRSATSSSGAWSEGGTGGCSMSLTGPCWSY